MAATNTQNPFTSLLNFRDVSATINILTGIPSLRPGFLYRSARPDEANLADRELLVKDYKIKTILDLRTPTELVEQERKHATSSPPTLASSPDNSSAIEKISSVEYVHVNLNGRNYSNALMGQLSYFNQAKLVAYYILGYRKDAIAILGANVMAHRGLDGLAIDTLVHSRAEVKEALDVLCDPGRYPVMVHCTQGKDRTGLIVALVLMVLGVESEAIGKDYQLSEQELRVEREERVKEIESIGMPESFADCSPDWMKKVWEFLEQEGGVEVYLKTCGVTPEQRGILRELLQEG